MIEYGIFEMIIFYKVLNIILVVYDFFGVYFIYYLFKIVLREGYLGIWMWVNI